jgi:hypothetical protein
LINLLKFIILFSLFCLEANNLDGTIPSEISNLEKLEFLGMENGRLVGQIPSSISNLQKLFFIDLDFNNLTGMFFLLKARIYLRRRTTTYTLTCIFYTLLNYLGTLSSELFSLTNLKQLDINNNNLSGPVNGLESLRKLEFLQLHHNAFVGTIPVGVADFTDLRVFTTYGNNFTTAPLGDICKNRDINGGNLTTLIADCSTPCPCCSSVFCG